mgnify:CR=1 FL=1
MMAELFLDIVTPSKSVFKGTVKSITVPGSKGRFQVLINHAPIISTFEIGMIKIDLPDGTSDYYSTGGGTIEVLNNNITVLADSIELVSEIDVDRALKAKQRAEERLTKRNIDKDIDVQRAEAALARAINRINAREKCFNQ